MNAVCCICKKNQRCYLTSHIKVRTIQKLYAEVTGRNNCDRDHNRSEIGKHFCETCAEQAYAELKAEKDAQLQGQQKMVPMSIPVSLQTNHTNSSFTCYVLSRTDEEYKVVSTLFHKTLGNEIIRIEKCHNPKLLEKFKLQKKGDETVHYLFHGSGNQNYDSILSQGFDISKARDTGMLGAGIYFAEDASYSNSYTHHLQTREKGQIKNMLCCRVVFGVLGKDTRVGSGIYAVFSEDQCYPEYIIYYSVPDI